MNIYIYIFVYIYILLYSVYNSITYICIHIYIYILFLACIYFLEKNTNLWRISLDLFSGMCGNKKLTLCPSAGLQYIYKINKWGEESTGEERDNISLPHITQQVETNSLKAGIFLSEIDEPLYYRWSSTYRSQGIGY